MIQKLFNLSYKRSFQDALIFYIFYLVVFYIFIIILEKITYIIFNIHNITIERWIGIFLVVFLSMLFSFLILFKKNLISDYRYIITVILVGILSYIFPRVLLSMIVIAYITMLQVRVK